MKTYVYLIPIILLFIVFLETNCNSYENPDHTFDEVNEKILHPRANEPNDVITYVAAGSIFGHWVYDNTGFNQEIQVNKDKTFWYIAGNNKRDTVKGRWTEKKNVYTLKGYSSMKDSTFGGQPKTKEFIKKVEFKEGFVFDFPVNEQFYGYYFQPINGL